MAICQTSFSRRLKGWLTAAANGARPPLLRRGSSQRVLQRVGQKVRLGSAGNRRRPDLERVAAPPDAVHQEATRDHRFHQIGNEITGGRTCIVTNSTPKNMPAPARSKSSDGAGHATAPAGSRGFTPPVLQTLLLDLVQRRKAGRGRDGVPAKGIEISEQIAEGGHDVGRARQAATGWPFAMGFPTVTMSGANPSQSWPQKWLPTRPKPGCTSSAMIRPPAARTAATVASRKPGATDGRPSLAKTGHSIKAENPYRRPQGPPPRGKHLRQGRGLSFCTAAQRVQRVGRGHKAHVRRPSPDRRTPGGQLAHRRRVAVIGVVSRDDSGLSGYRLRHAQRQIIRL